jgi:D-alanine-D-alanine ligase
MVYVIVWYNCSHINKAYTLKTIAVIFGGVSTEHDVSIITAIASIINPLRVAGGYEVEPVYISKDGQWYWDQKLGDVGIYQTGEIDDYMRKSGKVHLLFENGLTLVKSSNFAGRKAYKKIDVVFPAMHGTHGEDGSLMGLLEMAGVPYVGCGVAASAIAMDKVLSKLIAEAHGLRTPKMKFFSRDEYVAGSTEIETHINKTLKYPLFVKPAHLGSSIGITKVDSADKLSNAIEVATYYDDKVLVEEAVDNLIEVTVPIMGNDELRPAMVEQPMKLAEEVFDFDSKYIGQGGKNGKNGGKQGAQGYSKIPADIPESMYEKCIDVACKAYKAIGCSGIARVDLLIDSKTGTVCFNELNPMPGSLYAHNWRAAGVSNVQLVEDLVHLAEQRHKKSARSVSTFDTNFLKQF